MQKENSKSVLVVGGSSGIGFSTAKRLANSNWRVAIASRKPPKDPDHGLDWFRMDVTEISSVESTLLEINQKFSGIDSVVLCSGFAAFGAIEDTTCEEAEAQFDVNFFGTHRVCKTILPIMRAKGKGDIVIVGSLAGLIPLAFQAFYSASKHAIDCYAECLRYEVMNFGIRVVLIEPGDVSSEFTSNRVDVASMKSSSPYFKWATACKKRMQFCEVRGQSPEAVAESIQKILTNDSKRLRIRVTNTYEELVLLMRSWKLLALYDFVAVKEFGLKVSQ